MTLFDRWRGRRPTQAPTASLIRTFEEAGLCFRPTGALSGQDAIDWLANPAPFDDWELACYLAQLHQEGWGPDLDEAFILPWDQLYTLCEQEEHRDSIGLLRLPPACPYTASLDATGSFTDASFAIHLCWLDQQARVMTGMTRVGGIMRQADGDRLLPPSAWMLAEEVRQFARRQDRSARANRQAWAHLRALAVKAGAKMDDFLRRSVVISLDKLDLNMNLVSVEGTPVVELRPGAPDIPLAPWLDIFDKYSQVQDQYDLVLDDGTVMRIIPDEPVKQVLREIRDMPGRRVAGRRAKTFLRNPYAVLGPAMGKVVPPARFEELRRAAGIHFNSFSIHPHRDKEGRVTQVDIKISPDDEAAPSVPSLVLTGKPDVARFANRLAQAYSQGDPCLSFQDQELDLRGDVGQQLATLSALIADRWSSRQPVPSLAEIMDLSRYSARITGFDIYRPVYSPYIQKTEKGEGWLPDSIQPVIACHPPGADAPVHFTMETTQLDEMSHRVQDAQASGQSMIQMEGWPGPVSVPEALGILQAYQPLLTPSQAPLPPESPGSGMAEEMAAFDHGPATGEIGQEPGPPIQLTIAENIERDDYAEKRGELLAFDEGTAPSLPKTLAPHVRLLPHQISGVAWLQNLWRHPAHARGCVFADDMGLGKTLQLLTFIHWYLESDPDAAPVLVVAPVSLLENWQNEIRKFFTAGAARTLTLYGKDLDRVRLPASALTEEYRAAGVGKLLGDGWRGAAQIVLTTYETLRDQELSLARERWGIMVCDEAQKIKTPNALVTRAAKKQNVRFRIACTGTPVENSLTDVWCLFDFIQPGLLPPLNAFASTYVRPIEAKTDEQRTRVEALRALVTPQILRRTKADVAQLPRKHQETCELSISPRQRHLYSEAVNSLASGRAAQEAGKGGNVGNLILTLLHDIRMICAHPHHTKFTDAGGQALGPERVDSPKLDWLHRYLEHVHAKGEKAIVFTEFRDIQRLLQRTLSRQFGLPVQVINGDNKAQTVGDSLSRQRLIDAFQARPGFNVIILSTTAIGFGVNIQAANHVIHFTRPWNPAKEDQATDRAYRIGQEREVHVKYPTITSPDFVTFEAKLAKLLDAKRQLADDILNGYEDISFAEFSTLMGPDGTGLMQDGPIDSMFLRSIGPALFERLCLEIWKCQGYSVYSTPKSGDGGVDIVAIKGDIGHLVQCKTTSTGAALGWDAIKEVVGGTAAYEKRHSHIQFTRVAVANSYFNKKAKEQAALNKVKIIETDHLLEIIDKYRITRSSISK